MAAALFGGGGGGILGGLFGGGKDKKDKSTSVQPAPVAPADDAAAAAERDLRAENQRLRAASSGRASNILTSPLDDNEDTKNATRKLLGG